MPNGSSVNYWEVPLAMKQWQDLVDSSAVIVFAADVLIEILGV